MEHYAERLEWDEFAYTSMDEHCWDQTPDVTSYYNTCTPEKIENIFNRVSDCTAFIKAELNPAHVWFFR